MHRQKARRRHNRSTSMSPESMRSCAYAFNVRPWVFFAGILGIGRAQIYMLPGDTTTSPEQQHHQSNSCPLQTQQYKGFLQLLPASLPQCTWRAPGRRAWCATQFSDQEPLRCTLCTCCRMFWLSSQVEQKLASSNRDALVARRSVKHVSLVSAHQCYVPLSAQVTQVRENNGPRCGQLVPCDVLQVVAST